MSKKKKRPRYRFGIWSGMLKPLVRIDGKPFLDEDLIVFECRCGGIMVTTEKRLNRRDRPESCGCKGVAWMKKATAESDWLKKDIKEKRARRGRRIRWWHEVRHFIGDAELVNFSILFKGSKVFPTDPGQPIPRIRIYRRPDVGVGIEKWRG